MNADLHTFVRDALAGGASREAIRAALREARWPDDEVESALSAWHDAGLGVPVPHRRVGLSPREAFLYLLLFVALYLVAYNTGSVLFAWIERMWPDPAMLDIASDPHRDNVRFAVASLLVAFPVYLFTARITGRAVARDPEKRNSGVRRWLTYLTLFNAACVLIADLIMLLQGLLKGELTARFVNKALVVAAIAAWAFSHYMGGLKRDEADQPKRASTAWLARAAGVGVVLVTALGLWIAGAPARVRQQSIDTRRLYDLLALSNVSNDFFTTYRRLPEDLDELTGWNARTTMLHLNDPVSRAPYGYRMLDSASYELCATFDAPDSTDPYGRDVNLFWRHGKGQTCFSFRVIRTPPAPATFR